MVKMHPLGFCILFTNYSQRQVAASNHRVRQQKSEPYHTTVGFGFIFIYCTKRQCWHQNHGWQQQRSELYHAMAGFGSIFIHGLQSVGYGVILGAIGILLGNSPMFIFRCFLLNGGLGLLFGWLFRKYGLRYAMVAHGGCHIVSKLAWILLL